MELSQKTKLSVYQIYIPTLTYDHELWVGTERMRLQIQEAEMSFLGLYISSGLGKKLRIPYRELEGIAGERDV